MLKNFEKAHKNEYRTHTCAELRISDVGKQVALAGWIDTIRKLGGITFVTLRDHYGVTQLLFKDESMLNGLNKESVISATGIVIERVSKNPKMQTGDIEIEVEKLQLLSKAKPILPFEIADAPATKEELRLKYRFLDLRNEKIQNNILMRSKLLKDVRDLMHAEGFAEIQTPILTASSPEGARDFLVPSRLNPGKFFALPQSPQQFKQLLMVSGFDKYFQIAPCFRDEDARADRTPGEFYQMDMEMAFATQEDVFAVAEKTVYNLFKMNSSKEISPYPFKRIKFNESMEKYCSDKPDLRNPLLCHDLTQEFAQTTFNAFKGKTIKAIVAECAGKPRSFFDELTKVILANEGSGLAYIKVLEAGTLNGSVVKFMSEDEINAVKTKLNVKQNDVIFLIADKKAQATKLTSILRQELGQRLELIDNNKFEFCWIVDFPFFEWDEENNKLEFSHNPFSMPQGGMKALEEKNPLEIEAYQYDLVLNGVELASGAVRNHEPEIMVKVFEMVGYGKEVVENKFPALYNAFTYGTPPHAGYAFGFDRVVMFLCETAIIRDVIAFPFNKNAQDLLMNAPNEVFDKQLKELHIKVDLKD
ncbi:MAG: aspartate--tRNA ligase [Christensenellales bacterium]|jgi:aspartyl-tRNA synthetase